MKQEHSGKLVTDEDTLSAVRHALKVAAAHSTGRSGKALPLGSNAPRAPFRREAERARYDERGMRVAAPLPTVRDVRVHPRGTTREGRTFHWLRGSVYIADRALSGDCYRVLDGVRTKYVAPKATRTGFNSRKRRRANSTAARAASRTLADAREAREVERRIAGTLAIGALDQN
jgi:hypothetical protein